MDSIWILLAVVAGWLVISRLVPGTG